MSTPTRELEDLNLGGSMNRKQGGTRRHLAQQRRREQERQQRQQQQHQHQQLQLQPLAPAPPSTATGPPALGPPVPAADATGSDHVRGASDIRYRVRSLSPHARRTAEESLANRDKFHIEHPRRFAGYVAFQLGGGKGSVRISGPEEHGRRVKCGCDDFRRQEPSLAICAHVYWLYDRMNEMSHEGTDPMPTAPDLIDRRLAALFDQDIDKIPLNFQRAVWDDQNEDSRGEDDDELQAADVVALLDRDRAWGEGPDPIRPAVEAPNFQSLVVPGDWAATVTALFQHDRIIRGRLRNAITRDACAVDFVRKLDDRAKGLLDRFDGYADNEDAAFDGSTVARCADGLRDIVERLQLYNAERQPLNSRFHTEAARLAVTLLKKVLDRNEDIYENTPHASGHAGQLLEIDRNLFVHLVRSPPPGLENKLFVLDFLSTDFPLADLASVLNQLRSLRHLLRGVPVPQAFVGKLQELAQTAQNVPASEPPTPVTSSSRTPARAGASATPSSSVPARRAPSTEGSQRSQRRRRQE